jgi:hypothetical protein
MLSDKVVAIHPTIHHSTQHTISSRFKNPNKTCLYQSPFPEILSNQIKQVNLSSNQCNIDNGNPPFSISSNPSSHSSSHKSSRQQQQNKLSLLFNLSLNSSFGVSVIKMQSSRRHLCVCWYQFLVSSSILCSVVFNSSNPPPSLQSSSRTSHEKRLENSLFETREQYRRLPCSLYRLSLNQLLASQR